ncbi:fasciclin-like arabinogalactan protein 21 [Ricinus communis]|uniref:FAS1 domain-containing protein n=1 Tax=Ricinus communis TaxID=3988 RepID=B9SSK7_RICCO|nr:fasciclin-like arabinogalactan protein 21 [Ricinus communis]EEF33395.1 conserved hypothetical protein [Ricinus communis]|eukprot:XP_002528976.1 fasciclin-like arabinogalactan protein 21 [Ricinus communis]
MATSLSLPFVLLFAILTLSQPTSTLDTATTPSPPPPPPPSQTPHSSSPPPPISHDLHENSFFSHTALLAPILSHLGFTELSTAAPSLSSTETWSGPSTLFAPSDSSIHTCLSCSVPSLLREHIVPGLYTIDYLRKLAFGTKIETLSPGRCLTVTSTSLKNQNVNVSSIFKVFIGGVEITHPDLFNNGLIIIHGIRGYVAPLSPLSCDVERLNSLIFPVNNQQTSRHQFLPQPAAIIRLMLRDAMLRLRNNGFSILSLATRVKYGELVSLSNMTIFALDDASIFSGSHSYISSIRFHIVPNVYLSAADLERLPLGATLPTLERGQSLVVTTSSAGGTTVPMRINYVRLKVPDIIRNLKIVVHSVYLPFPRIDPAAVAFDGILGVQSDTSGSVHAAVGGSCSAVDMDENGTCVGAPVSSQFKPTVDLEEYNGL